MWNHTKSSPNLSSISLNSDSATLHAELLSDESDDEEDDDCALEESDSIRSSVLPVPVSPSYLIGSFGGRFVTGFLQIALTF